VYSGIRRALIAGNLSPATQELEKGENPEKERKKETYFQEAGGPGRVPAN